MSQKSALMTRLAEAAGRRRQIPLASGQRAPVGRRTDSPGPTGPSWPQGPTAAPAGPFTEKDKL